MNGDEGSVSSFGTDVTDLNNEELSEQLRSLGVNVGPIVGSTRRVYELKLAKLLGAGGSGQQRTTTTTSTSTRTIINGTNGTSAADQDDYSDSEPEPEPAPPAKASPAKAAGEYLRQRHIGHGLSAEPSAVSAAAVDPRSTSAVFLRDWDDQPSPRRGVREVRGSYDPAEYLVSKATAPVYGAPVYGSSDGVDGGVQQPIAASRGWLRALVKLLMLVLLIAACYWCYQNYNDGASFKSLQEAARAAVAQAAARVEGLRNPAPAPAPAPAAAAAGNA